jgi:hypothetical protein
MIKSWGYPQVSHEATTKEGEGACSRESHYYYSRLHHPVDDALHVILCPSLDVTLIRVCKTLNILMPVSL